MPDKYHVMGRKISLGLLITSLIGSGLLFLIYPSPLQAQVVISEVMPAPESGPEWVEIYNSGTAEIDLTGWRLEDQVSTASLIYTFGQQIMSAGQYLVIDLAQSKLNNSGDGVTLKDQTGQTVFSTSYEQAKSDQSWQQVGESQPLSWRWGRPSRGEANVLPDSTPSPSPGASPLASPLPSSIPSPSPPVSENFAPDLTVIKPSEILACPQAGQNEWLEIYNDSPQFLQLDDWQVIDASGNSRTFSLALNAYSLGTINWSGSLLNNTGDTVKLMTNTNQTIFQVSYTLCQKGQSLIYDHQTWQLTTTPTPNLPNIMTNPNMDQTAAQTENIYNQDETNTSSQTFLTTTSQDNQTCQDLFCQSIQETANFDFPAHFDPQQLILTTSPNQASADPDQNSLSQPQTTHTANIPRLKWPLVSVILGGGLLLCQGVFNLIRLYEQTKQEDNSQIPMVALA